MGEPMTLDKSKIKSRDPEMGKMWGAMSGWSRLRFVGSIMRLMFIKILPKALYGLVSGPTESGPLENVLPKLVWQARGVHNGIEGFMTVIRLDDDTLLLYNVVSPTAALIQQVRDLGVKNVFIVVPSAAHDSFAVFWKESFPEALVLCPRSSREKVAEVVEIAKIVEDSWEELVPSWKLRYVDNGDALNVDGELWYTLESPDGFRILLSDCGVMTSPGFRLSDALAGLGRWTRGPSARMNTAWGARVITDPAAYRKTLHDLAESGSWVVWASQHGRAITSNIKAALHSAANSV